MQDVIFVFPGNVRIKLISNGCRRLRSISGDAWRLGRSEIGKPRSKKPMQPLQTALIHLLRLRAHRHIFLHLLVKLFSKLTVRFLDWYEQLVACKAEVFLRLNQIEDSDFCLSCVPRLDHYNSQPKAKLFGMVAEAYVLCIQAQVDMALGR